MYIQRKEHVPLSVGDSLNYRYCLDAIIYIIDQIDYSIELMNREHLDQHAVYMMTIDRELAEEVAADLAHRLFEKWIRVVPDDESLTQTVYDYEPNGHLKATSAEKHHRQYSTEHTIDGGHIPQAITNEQKLSMEIQALTERVQELEEYVLTFREYPT